MFFASQRNVIDFVLELFFLIGPRRFNNLASMVSNFSVYTRIYGYIWIWIWLVRKKDMAHCSLVGEEIIELTLLYDEAHNV